MDSDFPDVINTERLSLRKPRIGDADEIFARYANDVVVSKYMSWPRHQTVDVTVAVVESWVEEWAGAAGGAYLITSIESGDIIGSTGIELLNPYVATTGYVLAADQWGKGFATEALGSIVGLAATMGLSRLFAYCHHEHSKSAHVLEKCDFEYEGRVRNYMEFPNLTPGKVSDVLLYAWIPAAGQ